MSLRRALLLAAAFGLAVSSNALAEPLEGESPAICVDAAPARSCAPSVEAKFTASFSPKALDKSKQTPASLRTTMEFSTEGPQPPALQQFEIGVDRHARLSLQGVPVCRGGGREPLQKQCREALIGTGKMVTHFQFPETTTGAVNSDVAIYNGGVKQGKWNLYAVTELTVPVPRQIVIPIVVDRGRGRYRLKLQGTVPKLGGGAGSITELALRLHRSVFSATCPDRHLNTRFGATFVDGTHLGGSVLRYCTPSP